MLFFAAFLALVAAIVIEYELYRKHSFDDLSYTATFSSSEVKVGDDIYLFEEIKNNGHLPIPYLKADTDLPEGLEFTLIETDKQNGKRKLTKTRSMQSLFVLHSNSKIRRRWRVRATKRGEYSLNGVVVSVSDILGINTVSKRLEPDSDLRTTVVVLPLPEIPHGEFSSSRLLCGDVISNLCPVTDPQLISGSREYTVYDPMNRINWKSTAAHRKLMVNIEDKTVRHRFSILLNMNSRPIEQYRDVPSDPQAVEQSIILCASLLDRIAQEEVPVKLFVNAPPIHGSDAEEKLSMYPDSDSAKISEYGPFRGSRQMLDAMRTLAVMPLEISLPPEKMFDAIISSPYYYGENESIIVVSPYIDGRMINFCRAMRQYGVDVSFFIATSHNNAGVIPGDVKVFFGI